MDDSGSVHSVAPRPKAHRQWHPLWDRYRAALAAAWAQRHQLTPEKLTADEAAFRPAALSLQATPPHPIPGRVSLAICALFLIALIWSIFGKIDIVAVASGRIVVTERTKVIQPLETSVVRRILVKDGDVVKAGQLLVELDPSLTQADRQRVNADLGSAASDQWRSESLLRKLRALSDGASKGRTDTQTLAQDDVPLLALLTPEQQMAVRRQLAADWQDIQAQLDKLGAEAAHRRAESVTVSAQIAKLEQTLPMLQQREKDFVALAAQGFISAHSTQDRTRDRVEMERDLETERARLLETQAALVESSDARQAYLADTEKSLGDGVSQANVKRLQSIQDEAKADRRQQLTQLTAPVDGTVQQVDISTDGGVVTNAQKLMVIVPRNAEVTADVVIDNKDIGFVRPGQLAEIKLETFEFTKYGTVQAAVARVTSDAVNDEKRGSIFPATLSLRRDSLQVDGKLIRLAPGMNLTAEIKIGKRRVIDYLLEPLAHAERESLNER